MNARRFLAVTMTTAAFYALTSSACSHLEPPSFTPLAEGDLPTLVFDLSHFGDSREASDSPREQSTTKGAFFSAPFPADARRTASGRIDVRNLPNPGGIAFVDASVKMIATDVDGFDPSAAIYFRFDRALPFAKDVVLDSQRDVPGVILIDIDPTSPSFGDVIPTLVRITSHHDGVRPANLLQVLPVPGRGGFEGKTHAVVVLRDLDQDGREDLGASDAIQELLSTSGSGRWHQSFELLRRYLASAKSSPRSPATRVAAISIDIDSIDIDSIAAATVYTHGTPTARLFRWVDHAMTTSPPALAVPLKIDREYDDYVVVTGALKMPIYQRGEPPHFFGNGDIEVDDDNYPVVQRTEIAPFVLTVPKGEVSGEVPLYFYIHGTGGLSTQAIDRGFRPTKDAVAPLGSGLGRWVADDGIATSCIAGTYSPERIGWRALDGYGAYVFFNPRGMRDNFAQMLLEQAHFLRFLSQLEIDAGFLPGVSNSSGDVVRLRPTIVGGQSLGSFLSGMFAALTGAFDGAVLTGAGGSWIEFGFGPKNPVDLAKLLDVIAAPKGEQLDRFHPFISMFQTAVGAADNTHYTPYLLRRQRSTTSTSGHQRGYQRKTPHLLVIEGQDDLQVPVHLQRALVLSVGVDLVGGDVGRGSNARLDPALRFGGLKRLKMAQSNRKSAAGLARTAGVIRYAEDGILEGHYVVFQRPDATHQLRSFAAAVARGEAPRIWSPVRDSHDGVRIIQGEQE